MTIEETRELHERYRDEVWLSPWRIDELFMAIDERDAKIAADATFTQLGKLFMDMIRTHCPTDDLPDDGRTDYAINAWLRMRAARDEALADVARMTVERDNIIEAARAVLSSTALWTDGLSNGDMEPIWKLGELVDAEAKP